MQKGEMLFQFKKNSSDKSSVYRQLVASNLGGETTLRALSHEAMIELRDFDKIIIE